MELASYHTRTSFRSDFTPYKPCSWDSGAKA